MSKPIKIVVLINGNESTYPLDTVFFTSVKRAERMFQTMRQIHPRRTLDYLVTDTLTGKSKTYHFEPLHPVKEPA